MEKIMDIVLINSPLVQLNTPYPSGAYLSAFFKSLEAGGPLTDGKPKNLAREANLFSEQKISWYDLSIQLFYSIFTRQGLTRLFELSSPNALKLAGRAELHGDDLTAFNLRRYISTAQNWINWIDDIVQILCGAGREKAHQLIYSPSSPRGSRMETFLANLGRAPDIDDARFLCSFALADLADYITAAFDQNFSLIRYAESLTVNESSFEEIEKQIDSPILNNFLEPVLDFYFGNIFGRSGTSAVASSRVPAYAFIPPRCYGTASQPFQPLTQSVMFCISVPFAGTFMPALYIARYLKRKYGNQFFIVAGGGFINTELRECSSPKVADYFDAISYDRGYGSYYDFLKKNKKDESVYKFRQFVKTENSVKIIEPLWQSAEIQKIEDDFTKNIVPDYSDIDFSIYPSLCDDKNPMHRLWVDGRWIKAYLSHGCYWHRCAFCDTQLDYVCSYKQTETEKIFYGLLKTAHEKNIYGIHFVDEALPPQALQKFAILNAQNKNQLYYWGNIRFEKSFSYDLVALLSYCGFGGVSAGIEAATNKALQSINKGTDIHNIVNAACAFKENGILVHAYMIYGFWNDTPQSIIDSLETLRQLFEQELLDSAFWHKFVLTRNSGVFAEWQKGLHPELKPLLNKEKERFAKNNLHFAGEEKYSKFGDGLESAVNSWMHRQKLQMKVTKWFDFAVPEPTVPKNFISEEIQKYEQKKNKKAENLQFSKNLFWVAGNPLVVEKNHKFFVNWLFMQDEMSIIAEDKNSAVELCSILRKLRPEKLETERQVALQKILESKKIQQEIKKLYGSGIIEVNL